MGQVEQQIIQEFQTALNLLRDPERSSPHGMRAALEGLKMYLENTDDYAVDDSVIIFAAQALNELKRFLDSNHSKFPQYNTEGRRRKLADFISGLNTLARQIKDARTNERTFFRTLSDVKDEIPDAIVLIGRIIALNLGYGAVFSMAFLQKD